MRLRQVGVLAICLALFMTISFGCATTQKAAAPAKAEIQADWKFHDIVDVNFVQEHVKVPMQEDVMLIDARSKRASYDKGHIPMAVSIPDSKFDKMVAKLPKNKNTLLVFYCEGLK